MSQLLKKLLAADRERQLKLKGQKLTQWYDSTTKEPASVSHMDYLKFAEQYMGHVDEKTGEYVPMKFTEADRYLFEQIELAQEEGLTLFDSGWRTRRNWSRNAEGKKVVDGSEVHYLTHEPWERPFLDRHRREYPLTPSEAFPLGRGGTQFKITLDRKAFQPPMVDMGNVQVPRADIKFVKQEGDKVTLSVPINGSMANIEFTDQPALWNLFPEIAKQLGKL